MVLEEHFSMVLKILKLAGHKELLLMVLCQLVLCYIWVPQGSILGPMLFVLLSYDLPDVIPEDSEAALYAENKDLPTNTSE